MIKLQTIIENTYIGAIVYTALFFVALTTFYYINYKLRISRTKTKVERSFKLAYLGIALALAGYAISDTMGILRKSGNNPGYNTNITFLLITLAYSLLIPGLNSFILRSAKFRKNVARIITGLAILETLVTIGISGLIIPAMFNEDLEYLSDIGIGIVSFVAIAFLTFTSIILLVESAQTVNKMTKLRIRMVAIGSLGLLFNPLLNVLPFAFTIFSNSLYWNFLLPLIDFIVFSTMLISFYFALFPPLWLQRLTNVLPPSFADLMKKRNLLERENPEVTD